MTAKNKQRRVGFTQDDGEKQTTACGLHSGSRRKANNGVWASLRMATKKAEPY
jgi:hypothetical protein